MASGRDPMTGQALSAQIAVERTGFTVSAGFEVAAGDCLAVLGPNGAGKSTLLAALAGLTSMTGEIRVGDRVLDGAGHVPPEHRRIALLEQKPRLFPHLSVRDNLAFGPRSQARSRRAARSIADGWLERIGLPEVGSWKPSRLSGGQQQRVAIARALAAAPEVLLLDEPFAALDAASAPTIRAMLADELIRTGTTAVLVTHELSDAWQFASRCLVLAAGSVVDDAAPAELAARPRHPFTAALAGYAVVHGRWDDGALLVGDDVLPGEADGEIAVGAAAFGIVVPHEVRLSTTSGAVRSRVRSVAVHAGRARVASESGLVAEVAVDAALPRVGDRVWLTPTGMRVLAEGEATNVRDPVAPSQGPPALGQVSRGRRAR